MFNSSTELNFIDFCDELINNVEELNKVGIFEYTKEELKIIVTNRNYPERFELIIKALNTPENKKAFDEYINSW